MTNDGGPAFPIGDNSAFPPQPGISTRDYFAAQAMIGEIGAIGLEEGDAGDIASRCYAMADAMLKARQTDDE